VMVASTGSATDPLAGSKALPEPVEGSIEKADGGFDRLNHQRVLWLLSLSKHRNARWGKKFYDGGFDKLNHQRVLWLLSLSKHRNTRWWKSPVMVVSTGSTTKNPADKTRSLSLWLLSLSKHRNARRGKSLTMVVSTGSTTDPPAGSKALPEPVEGSIEKADGGFDKLNHQRVLRMLSLSKHRNVRWGEKFYAGGFDRLNHRKILRTKRGR